MRKIYLILVGSLMMPFFLMSQTPSCSSMGDADGNGVIEVVDALLIAQVSVGLNPVVFYAACADVNCSGSVEIIDALLITQLLVGSISDFPCKVTPVPTATPTSSGNPYQRGPDPSLASVAAMKGTFATAQISVSAGNGFGGGYIYYPTDTSLGTWAAVAICPGFSAKFANEEAWMGPWLASFGFIVIGIETNTTSDGADARAAQLLAALDYLTKQSSVRDRVDPNRLMVMGHSAGGAGSLIAALQRSSLKTVVGLAPGAPNNSLSMINLRMPIMLISGQNDNIVTPTYVNGIWTSLLSTTQRIWVELANNDHLSFTKSNPTEMRVLIPWMKIFLDKDTRYIQFLCPLADKTGISNYNNSCPLVP